MASSKLIGTAPDQVPTNADLGELAFQNKDSVEFTSGKGGLSSLDLTAIAASKNVSATDIFVYDTSKDSDGGAWRNRCQNTSWYNEDLNTATRGSRREFPSVAVIVLETYAVKIYDGDSPDLPMWMVINRFAGANTWWHGFGSGYPTPTALYALNGIICVTSTDSGNSSSGLSTIRLVADQFYNYSLSSAYSGVFSQNIANRALTGSFGGATASVHLASSDVAMTVLPNAPIDAATGLPTPTIAVATDSGVSVIRDTGAVVKLTNANSAFNAIEKISFIGDKLCLVYSYIGLTDDAHTVIESIPNSDLVYNSGYGAHDKSINATSYNALFNYPPFILPYTNMGGQLGGVKAESDKAQIFAGNVSGLSKLMLNSGSASYGMVNNVATKYNTGWMPGDIKGAWLSDTTQETVVGTELITNGTFNSNTTGWTGTLATLSVSSGQLVVTGTSSVSANQNAFQDGIPVIPGAKYILTTTIVSSNNSTAGFNLQGAVIDSNSFNGWKYFSGSGANGGINTPSTIVETITATAPTLKIGLHCGIPVGSVATFDNVSVRLADADRSVNNKGLQVYGSITKTPVATGADLVAYSGFSSSNYLEQPYNSALDFGTGDFCYTGWYNHTAASGMYQRLIDRGTPSLAGSCIAAWVLNGTLYFRQWNDAATTYGDYFSYAVNSGTWTHYAIVRRSGYVSLYLNGVLVSGPTAYAGNVTNTSAVLTVGESPSHGASLYWAGSLALFRASATAPSADQIAKMYNDEKVLFQDNAKATLYGTSDAVTALAYDQDTKLLHVGTSSGRSVFQGLRRVDNTTTAVSTSISAANGLVAEN